MEENLKTEIETSKSDSIDLTGIYFEQADFFMSVRDWFIYEDITIYYDANLKLFVSNSPKRAHK